MNNRFVYPMLWIFAASSLAFAAETAGDASPSRFTQANAHVQDAIISQAQKKSDQQTAALFIQAEEIYRSLLNDSSLSPVSQARIRYNLGTTLLMRQKSALALIELRQAERLCPLWQLELRTRILDNLQVAREAIKQAGFNGKSSATSTGSDSSARFPASPPRFPADPKRSLSDWLILAIPRSAAGFLCAIFTPLAAALIGLRLSGYRRHQSILRCRLMIPLAAILATIGLSTMAAHRYATPACEGVLTRDVVLHSSPFEPTSITEHVDRSSSSSSAQTLNPQDQRSSATSLPAGCEVVILQQIEPLDPAAPAWVEVAPLLTPRDSGWISSSALQLIQGSLPSSVIHRPDTKSAHSIEKPDTLQMN